MAEPESGTAGWDRLRAELAKRVRRARPDRVVPGAVPVVAAVWVSGAVLAWTALLPFAPIDGSGLPADWVRVVLYSGIAVLTATGVLAAIAASARSAGFPWSAMALAAAVAVGTALPLLAFIGGPPWAAVLSGASALAGTALAVAACLRHLIGRGWLASGAALLCAVPWLLSAVVTSGQAASEAEGLWRMVGFIGVEVFSLAAFYGFATAARKRADASRRVLVAGVSRSWLAAALGAALLVMILRLTVAHDLFSDPYGLWSLRTPASWPMSALLAGLIVYLTLRSERRPLQDRGFTGLLAVLVIGFAYPSLVMVAATLSATFDDLFAWPSPDFDALVECGPIACLSVVWFAVSATLVVFIVLPRWRRTTGRAAALVATPYLLAGTAAPSIDALWPGGPAWWASPAPIALVLVIIAIVIAAGQWFGRWETVSRTALVRIAVYPVVVLHAVDLLPAFVDGRAQTAVAVILLMSVLLLFLPPVASDPVRQTAVLTGASVSVLFGLLGTIIATVQPERGPATAAIATLMLSVPVFTVLLLRVEARKSPAAGDGEGRTRGRW